MKVKTADLIDAPLDWAVAQCASVEVEYINDGITRCLLRVSPFTGVYRPSTDWEQGGPIIERGNIDLISPTPSDPLWQAMQWRFAHGAKGPTPLIAAMRCHVTSELGDKVEIPDELLK